MKKFIGILVLGLLWCNVVLSAPAHKLIRTCAEYFYGQELTDKQFESVMSPSNLNYSGTSNHAFVENFIICEKMYEVHPYTIQEIFD